MLEAVIPAAGRGLRFLPLTKEQPKELLPVVDKPVIHYVVEEAARSGVEKVLIITGRHKRSFLEDYFDRSSELERLKSSMVKRSLDMFLSLPQIYFVRQPTPLGLGDAVLQARNLVVADEGFFLIMLGDTINVSVKPVAQQLIEIYRKVGDADAVIALQKVEPDKVSDYGIVGVVDNKGEGREYSIKHLVEKPRLKDAPSDLGITGTYVVSKRIFEFLAKTKKDRHGEIQLTNALQLMVDQGLKIIGYNFEGKRYDIGDMTTWMKANFELTLKSKTYGPSLRKHISDLELDT
ncbi:MAG: UTP--glucose-1-phosphate uridylyltransferase [Nitrososphaerales archaeon]